MNVPFCSMMALFGWLSLVGCRPDAINESTTVPRKTAQVPTKPTLEEARKQVASVIRKGVPLGSTRVRVEAWLKSTERQPWYVEGKALGDAEYKSVLQKYGYSAADLGGMIVLLSRENVRGSAFSAATVFFFDKRGQLIASSVDQIDTTEMKRVPGKPTLEEMRHAIAQKLPVGSSRVQVETWLKSKKIKHTYLDSKKHDLSFPSSVSRSGHRPADLGGIINAIIRENSRGFARRTDILMTFFFDKRGKLIDYSVEEFGTGL